MCEEAHYPGTQRAKYELNEHRDSVHQWLLYAGVAKKTPFL